MGSYHSVIVPKCKLYDNSFQRMIHRNNKDRSVIYEKETNKWFIIYPKPLFKQKIIYR